MAKPNFHDRSWQEIDWETWGSQFSIVDRASSLRELQNGIGTRYMEVQDLLSQLPPFMGGGEMIETVTMERSTYAPIPHKFEAGTPPIVEAVGLGAAVDYLSVLGMESVQRHERAITAYALEGLQTVPGLTVLGPLDAAERGGAISFEIPDEKIAVP